MGRPVVVVTDPIHEDGVARLSEGAETIVLEPGLSSKSLNDALARAEALIIRAFKADERSLAACPRLKVVAKHGSGVDNIDIDAATARGIAVLNTPGGANATAVAEGAVALMLAVRRRILDMHQAVVAGRFLDARRSVRLGDLWGSTLGLVGLGHIGSVVARICGQGFAMRVLAYDPFVDRAQARRLGAEKVESLQDLMREADVVSIHVPLSQATERLVDAAAIAAMKESAILINTSRGPVADEQALIAALGEHRIAGAGLDVFAIEPPHGDSPLLSLPNVVLSPHMAGVTNDSLRQMALSVADLTLRALKGERVPTLLNPQALRGMAG